MNWKWPATPKNDYFPWYLILWHGLWFIPFWAARIQFVLTVLIYTLNIRCAGRAWDETR